jgi:hypothetical protein
LHQVKESVSAVDGVRSIRVNPDAGSIVIHYSGRNPVHFEQAIAEQGRLTGAYDPDPPEIGVAGEVWKEIEREANFLAAHSELARSVVSETKKADIAVKRATGNTLDLKVLVPLGLAVLSVTYLGTDVSTPLWVTLGAFSFNSFVSLHPPLPYPQTKGQAQS